ncbi:penicillin acylase family protein [Streptomyces sp. NPDC050848]|uniref:penicillin acylase family protein n=1 Tax=Streptomyces sp. NPDC050848 TaxID=3155791 RepID=UPI0033D6F2BC
MIGVRVGIEVYRDDWGIPHLRGTDPDELAFAQGRVTAVDRAWQLEVERHRAQGTTAAFLGAGETAWDVFARQARLADTARRCFDRLDGRTARWVRAYVDGVNAGLPEGAARAGQFARVGLAPGRWEPWTPLAVWLTTHILFAGFPAKLWREEVARRLGEEWTELFATDGPGTSGSNGWLVSGGRTASGSAIIAGDPHRFIEAPGVYQQIRLACPEYDVLGMAVPGIPGLAHFGHTGGVAWAITNAMSDYQDLYRERLRRTVDGGVEALGPDGWRPASVHRETVEVAGGSPVEIEVIETERGPVIIGEDGGPGAAPEGVAGDADDGVDGGSDGSSGDGVDGGSGNGSGDGFGGGAGIVREAISLRYPPRVTGELGFAVLPELLAARTVADVDRAVDRWVEPVNVVLAADVDGGLLHRVAGYVPVRDHANSVRVVPAWEAAHAWRDGAVPTPRADVEGHAVMANARGIAAPLGIEFAPPHRAARIDTLLADSTAWTPEAMADVHTDTDNPSAARLLAAIRAAATDASDAGAAPEQDPGAGDADALSPGALAVRARLLAWDRRMEADSTEAGLYAAVRGAVVRRVAGHPAFAALREPAAYPEVFRPWLALGPRVAFALETLLVSGPVPAADVAGIVRAALEEVAAGEEPPAWGVTHRLAPWQALPDEDDDAQWPGLAGDHDCVMSSSSVPGYTDRSARASAARYVWDLADRDRSLWIVPFGASGVADDPHHRDQLPLWLRGGLAPVTTDWHHLTKEHPHDDRH